MNNINEFTWQYLGNHLVIERYDKQPITVEWDVIQAIKNEAVGEEFCAVEIYPPEDMVVNEVNRRHLWLVPYADIKQFNLFRR
jgi:hypothetical protein